MTGRKTSTIALCTLLFLLSGSLARAQLILGQYEDEAPLASWNSFGLPGAAALGLAGTQYAASSEPEAMFANPSLLARLPRFTASLTVSHGSAELYRFAMINTGVIGSESNLSTGFDALESAVLTCRLKGWALGLGFGLLEVYDRPVVDVRDSGISFDFGQSGYLDVFNLSLARAIGSNLSLGLGVNILTGRLERSLNEDYGAYTITDEKSHDFSGLFFGGGITFEFNRYFRLAAVFRSPYTKKTESESLVRYESRAVDISFEASSEDTYEQPWIAGLGAALSPIPEWLIGLDVSYFAWSRYNVNSFGEPMRRDFRDTLKLSAGTSYTMAFVLSGQKILAPVRLGIAYDPQPMKEPRSGYLLIAAGLGLQWRFVSLDLAILGGSESGSERSLATRKVMATLSFAL